MKPFFYHRDISSNIRTTFCFSIPTFVFSRMFKGLSLFLCFLGVKQINQYSTNPGFWTGREDETLKDFNLMHALKVLISSRIGGRRYSSKLKPAVHIDKFVSASCFMRSGRIRGTTPLCYELTPGGTTAGSEADLPLSCAACFALPGRVQHFSKNEKTFHGLKEGS